MVKCDHDLRDIHTKEGNSFLFKCLKCNKIKKLKQAKENITEQKKSEYTEIKKCTVNNRYIKQRIQSRVWSAVKGKKIHKTVEEILGCDINKFREYLEKQFKEGMNWDNYGEWHIDHKLPCNSFDLSKIDELLECFNYKNLQPLWARENCIKGCKVKNTPKDGGKG